MQATPATASSKNTEDIPSHCERSGPVNAIPRWICNPFAPPGRNVVIHGVEDAPNAFGQADCSSWTGLSSKGPCSLGPTPKPRPVPIYKDKRVEEYWSFLRSVPDAQKDQSPSLSRCPSLMSGGTLSSRNSSTRSTRSSVWGPIDGDFGTLTEAVWTQDVQVHSPASAYTAASVSQRPASMCEDTCRNFGPAVEQARHEFETFDGILRCEFCTKYMDFPSCPNRVDLFMRHLVEKHGAAEFKSDNGKRKMSTRSLSLDEPVASCSICTEPFSAQGFYEHLPGCIVREVTRSDKLEFRFESNVPKHGSLSEDSGAVLESKDSTLPPRAPKESGLCIQDDYSPLSPPISIAQPHERCDDMASITESSRCLSLTSSHVMDSSEDETDWTEEHTSRESSPGASQVPRRLSPAKRKIVDGVMQDFHVLFSRALRTHTSGGTTSNAPSRVSGGWSSNASVYSTSSFTSRKRSLSGGGSSPPDDEDETNKRRKPDAKANGRKPIPELRLACPYYKRNPGRHQTFTSCRDPGFVTVARLKEHLYRRHLLPPQCNRCCTTFSTDIALREHQRDPAGCQVKDQVALEGFDKDQERQLKSKKKSQVYQTEDEKWKSVYRILFPEDSDTDIPTPYIEYQPCTGEVAEPSHVLRFQQFSRLELPRLVRRTLEAVVEQEAQPLEDKLKDRLVDIVKECQTQLFAMFQTIDGPKIKANNSPTTEVGPPATFEPSASFAQPSTQSGDFVAMDIFDDFGFKATHTTGPSFVAVRSKASSTLPSSSNSSDSGYDSTWASRQANIVSTDGLQPNLALPVSLECEEYFQLGNHSELCMDGPHTAGHSLATASGSTSEEPLEMRLDMSSDPSIWNVLEPLAGMDESVNVTTHQLGDFGMSWHI